MPGLAAQQAGGGRRPPPAPGGAPPAPAGPVAPAVAFIERFTAAIGLEVQVQSYEYELLGKLDPGRLNKYQVTRRARIDDDRAHFAERFGQVWVRPLAFEEAWPDREVSPGDKVLLGQMRRAYESTRDLRAVNRYVSLNEEFLDTGNWIKREAAVVLRDQFIAREITFQNLSGYSTMLAKGHGNGDARIEITEALREAAPEAIAGDDSLVLLVLGDDEVRKTVLADVTEFLVGVPPPAPRAAPDELVSRIEQLKAALIAESGLTEVEAELGRVEQGIEDVEARLASLQPFEIDARRAAVDRRNELWQRRNELRAQWRDTEPAPGPATDLVAAYDELLRLRTSELGMGGALFGARLDALDRHRELARGRPAHTWMLLDEQVEVLNALEEVRPAPDYLEGLPPPPDAAALAALRAAEQQASAAEVASLKKQLQQAPKKPKPKGQSVKSFFGGGKKGGKGGRP